MPAVRRGPTFAATTHQGAEKRLDTALLNTKLSFNWVDRNKILTVRPAPASDTPDDRRPQHKLFPLDPPSDFSGKKVKRLVSVVR